MSEKQKQQQHQQQLISNRHRRNPTNILVTSRLRPSLSHDSSSCCSSSCSYFFSSSSSSSSRCGGRRQNSMSIIMTIYLTVVVALLVVVSMSSVVVQAAPTNNNNNNNNNGFNVVKLPSLYWHVNNRLFSDSNQQEPNYYLKLNAHLGESIDLVCPRTTSWSSNSSSSSSTAAAAAAAEEAETYGYAIIYRVASRHEFDNCIVDVNNYETVPILKCDKPHSTQLVKFTIYFVKYSPVPNALEFEEDKEYFFLSTSSGGRQGLNYASGGLCSKYNMRFSIRIQSSSRQQHNDVEHSPKRGGGNSLLSKINQVDTDDDDFANEHAEDINDDDDDEENELDELDTSRRRHGSSKHHRHHSVGSKSASASAPVAAASSLDELNLNLINSSTSLLLSKRLLLQLCLSIILALLLS